VPNYAYHTSENQIYLNGQPANFERKDIETFAFQNGKLHIRGKNADNDLCDEFLSLDEDTERAEKAAQIAEKQNNAALLEMLKKL
jgi:hypothetical protein